MTPKRWIPAAALLAALTLSACSATKARINDNEELFASYPPEVQAMIRSNRIDRGFDSTQVYLALGNAERTESVDGRELWYWYQTHTDTVEEEKSASEYRDELREYEDLLAQGRKDLPAPTTYRTIKLFRTRVARVVEFEEGVVASWEEPEAMWVDEWHQ